MSKTEEAVKYMISVWDEVRGNWRETPDHVERKFLDAEAELVATASTDADRPTPDTQELELDKILETEIGHEGNFCAKYRGKACNCGIETATKAIEQNYILKSQVLAAIPEKNVNQLEKIIADHNKEMRTDMASEITGGTRSKAITDVITLDAILKWHSRQIKSTLGLEEETKHEAAM